MVFGWLKRRAKAAAPAVEPGGEGGEWRVLAKARQLEVLDGQTLEYPGRTAECPRGHRRLIPTRFDQAVVELTCAECGRRYPLRSS